MQMNNLTSQYKYQLCSFTTTYLLKNFTSDYQVTKINTSQSEVSHG